MKKSEVYVDSSGQHQRLFTKALLDDVRALEVMIERGLIETGVRRIGAEQEVFLVDATGRPAPVAVEVLEELKDAHFTPELGRFNLEFNMDPQIFSEDGLSQMEQQMNHLLAKAGKAAETCDADVILVGILPTLQQGDLSLDNMTPSPRYMALNQAMNKLRGSDYQFRIQGVDELVINHDSVMAEACNTSFQVHFQVGPEEFARCYNAAQAVTGPVLSASTNAPLLFGRRLWRETRIALFEQSVDTRRATAHLRDQPSRVSFGQEWVKKSVLEIYRDDISRFKALFGWNKVEVNPLRMLEEGRLPPLTALQLHNGTLYRWNRPCYGVADGVAHIRIEARFLPSGPTILDELANAAFWFGLLSGVIDKYGDITEVLTFEQAKANFLAAATHGLNAQFTWINGETVPAHELIVDRLLPLAHRGLEVAGVAIAERERYLGVIEERVISEQTGSGWLLDSLAKMGDEGTRAERMNSLTIATVSRQKTGKPVHEWPLAKLQEAGSFEGNYATIEQYMDTDLFTVNKDEAIDLVANVMDWQRVRYVPVEDDDHHLVGLVTSRTLLRYLIQNPPASAGEPIPVSKIMHTDIQTVTPQTRTLDAIALMQGKSIGCLPVIADNKLVGMVSGIEYLEIAKMLVQEKLSVA